MILDEREKYTLWRRKHKVKLQEVAAKIGCCVSLLSKFENNKANLSEYNKNAYDNFIRNFMEGKFEE